MKELTAPIIRLIQEKTEMKWKTLDDLTSNIKSIATCKYQSETTSSVERGIDPIQMTELASGIQVMKQSKSTHVAGDEEKVSIKLVNNDLHRNRIPNKSKIRDASEMQILGYRT